jgi:pimeloyl-ACP methyl ester carboxylesterase
VPAPLRNEKQDSIADVFFLHPTTFTKKKDKHIANAAINDHFINAKTDYSSILYQASVFNQSCRVFAPRYRQAHIHNFFSTDTLSAAKAFDLAYDDIRKSFLYYLQHWNNGKPLIIAGHSQGALLAERLLKEFFEEKDLQNKLVAAYIIGWPVPAGYFSSLPMCRDSLQQGCVISWRTFRKGYVPPYLKNEKDPALATNPLTWKTDSIPASKLLNKGSVLTKFNKVYPHTTDARLKKGLLNVKKPKFPWSFLYFTRNYHIADINLFYLNIRENVNQRIKGYK